MNAECSASKAESSVRAKYPHAYCVYEYGRCRYAVYLHGSTFKASGVAKTEYGAWEAADLLLNTNPK